MGVFSVFLFKNSDIRGIDCLPNKKVYSSKDKRGVLNAYSVLIMPS